MMHRKELLGLRNKSYEHRKTILSMINNAKSGHCGGSLGIIDVLTILYDKGLRHNPKKPLWNDRDRVVLSAGHLCPALYAVLSDQGYFPKKELKTLRKLGSRLQGHQEKGRLPGIENTGGPLGQGLSFASGIALALKNNGSNQRVFCITSDGEHQEGGTWEAVQFAAHHKLSNLCVIIDRNNVQINGFTEDEVSLRNLKSKYHSFGWNVIEIDGHNHRMIADALKYYSIHKLKKPFCIIAHTTLGKGVSFMEDEPIWHGRAPNDEELKLALKELDNKQRRTHLHHHLKKKKVLR